MSIQVPLESYEQERLHGWCQNRALVSYAVPNAGKRSVWGGKNFVKQGLVEGVSDYVVLLEDKILYIELKRQPKKLKSGKMSVSHTPTTNEQIEFIEKVSKFSYAIGRVCYGFDEARSFISEYASDEELKIKPMSREMALKMRRK